MVNFRWTVINCEKTSQMLFEAPKKQYDTQSCNLMMRPSILDINGGTGFFGLTTFKYRLYISSQRVNKKDSSKPAHDECSWAVLDDKTMTDIFLSQSHI